jgi:hypothetical protein
MRRGRVLRLAPVAIVLAVSLSLAGLYLEGQIKQILVTNAGWGTGPRCSWSGGQLVLCGSPAVRDAALREEAIRRGYLEPSP